MFKKRIAFKLTLGFVVIVLISMLTIGLVFINIFRQYAFDSRQKIMLERAHNISEVLSENLQSNGQMRGFGGFMRFLDTMAEAKVWIIDRQGNPVALSGMGMGTGMAHTLSPGPLPEAAENVIQDVLSGKESVSESFSNVYNEATLTIGVPILDSDKNVIGSVLLHAPITGITGALNKTISILSVSLLIALLIAVGLGIFYSIIFTRPLKTMNRTALEMARGNYNARTGINRQDEIGQLGDSLDLLASELSEATEEINKLEQVRRDFVANVSHEFRTPLTVIRGSLEALSDGTIEDTEDIKRFYQRMLSETRGLERLVSDLLELSRLQSGKITIHKEHVHIPSLLSDIIKSMQTIADKKEIQIDFITDDNVPPVLGDYDRLRQLFVIFIDNAIKYSPDKTIVTVTTHVKDSLEILIQDQGYGIAVEELPYVWDRFYKTDKSRKSSGTGLGLAIAKHLIKLNGGSVELKSAAGKGTTIEIQLPVQNVDEQ
ncbi:sensor histidine kinase [Acetivibrio cellulolyticus]|uniref:sensor histidine kinase n=1 Tax=Acetivibrio cellulolyticus TaxID=35830 RepID=UPI0001E2D10D|nr:ATP-binding protein [Acetivibrio cellulolyticus]